MSRLPKTTEIYPNVDKLLDSTWVSHPERYTRFTEASIKIAGGGDPFHGSDIDFINFLSRAAKGGKILDVGCNIFFGLNPSGKYSTPVGTLSNAYGIDPALTDLNNKLLEKAIAGRAEDLPFLSNSFSLVLSKQALGFYPEIAFDTYWSLMEMLRVTDYGGIISIQIGEGAESKFQKNVDIILDTLERIRNQEEVGKKILTSNLYDNNLIIEIIKE